MNEERIFEIEGKTITRAERWGSGFVFLELNNSKLLEICTCCADEGLTVAVSNDVTDEATYAKDSLAVRINKEFWNSMIPPESEHDLIPCACDDDCTSDYCTRCHGIDPDGQCYPE